ncbi:hypothetical protein ATCC90586_006850 [Pythium insidiosum]|nr:hypothetical protein ATCC90586_006850 [Pythium insidiosum]
MSKEGYLILHEDSRRSQLFYCVLGEGKLQFFSRRDTGGVMLKEVLLSKSKLKIRGIADQEARDCPFSFSVAVHRSKIVDGRQVVFGKPIVLILSAPSWAERKSWGNAIYSWQRSYWSEPMHLADRADFDVELFFAEQRSVLEQVIEAANSASHRRGRADSEASSVASTSSRDSNTTTTSRRSFVAMNPSKMLMNRAKALKQVGTNVRKKMRSASVTISLPPMMATMASSLQQTRPQQQQQQ